MTWAVFANVWKLNSEDILSTTFVNPTKIDIVFANSTVITLVKYSIQIIIFRSKMNNVSGNYITCNFVTRAALQIFFDKMEFAD